MDNVFYLPIDLSTPRHLICYWDHKVSQVSHQEIILVGPVLFDEVVHLEQYHYCYLFIVGSDVGSGSGTIVMGLLPTFK